MPYFFCICTSLGPPSVSAPTFCFIGTSGRNAATIFSFYVRPLLTLPLPGLSRYPAALCRFPGLFLFVHLFQPAFRPLRRPTLLFNYSLFPRSSPFRVSRTTVTSVLCCLRRYDLLKSPACLVFTGPQPSSSLFPRLRPAYMYDFFPPQSNLLPLTPSNDLDSRDPFDLRASLLHVFSRGAAAISLRTVSQAHQRFLMPSGSLCHQ